VIVVAHRPAILATIDKILALRDGLVENFGPRQEVIQRYLNARQAPQPQSRPQGPANVVTLNAAAPANDPNRGSD
jgi:ABC-type protease/lipase transport system fused ATPase/permease subunit